MLLLRHPPSPSTTSRRLRWLRQQQPPQELSVFQLQLLPQQRQLLVMLAIPPLLCLLAMLEFPIKPQLPTLLSKLFLPPPVLPVL
jgi:hypothetical protein